MEIKTKINKWDIIQLKSFRTMEETIRKMKRQPSEREKIIANETTDEQPNWKAGKTPKQIFLQRRHTDANKYLKTCSAPLISREMQIKTTVRYHLTLVRQPSSKSLQNKCWKGCGEKKKPSHTVGNANWYSHYAEQCGDSLKSGNREAIWPNNPTTRHIQWGNQNWKRHLCPNVHCSTIYNS